MLIAQLPGASPLDPGDLAERAARLTTPAYIDFTHYPPPLEIVYFLIFEGLKILDF